MQPSDWCCRPGVLGAMIRTAALAPDLAGERRMRGNAESGLHLPVPGRRGGCGQVALFLKL